MTRAQVQATIRYALDFQVKANAYLKATKPRMEMMGDHRLLAEPNCPVESGTLRRGSLDLTRALAQMRKPGV